MYIEELEKQIVTLLKESAQFRSVKRYAGELEKDGLLRTAAGNIPAALIFTAGMEECAGLDQLPTEALTVMVILVVGADPDKNDLHNLRRFVRQTLDGFDASGALATPLTSVRTDALAIMPTLSVYAMQYQCEVYGQ